MAGGPSYLLLLGIVLLSIASPLLCDAKKYARGDVIPVYANKIGPFQNPTETYRFYTLPFCEPKGGPKDKLEDLGEVMTIAASLRSAQCSKRAMRRCSRGIG